MNTTSTALIESSRRRGSRIAAAGSLGLMPLLLVLLAWPSIAAAQLAWKTTDWAVVCLDVSDGTCDEAAGANDYFETSLEDASRWLSALGFGGPAIEYWGDTNEYVAYISDENNERGDGGRKSVGVYYPGEKEFHLTSDRYFAIGVGATEKERTDALASDIQNTGAVVHELFHAVQYGYYGGRKSAPGWITEGMADAVLMAWLRRGLPHERMLGGARAFDFPLHKPRNKTDAYETARFWRGVGKILRSPNDIGYLTEILEQDLAANWGLGGVDEGLRKFDKDGLYNLYPEFIARLANSAHFFHEVDPLGLVYEPGEKVEKSIRGTVREVAANAIEVSVQVPPGKTAVLKLKLAHQHDDLHLIVDGLRLDKAAGSRRNVFHATVDGMPDPQKFLVRIANVATSAIDSGNRMYLLDASLTPTSGERECTLSATIDIEPIEPYLYFMGDGEKLPIKRTESVEGTATIDDLRHHLTFHYDDTVGHAGSGMFTVDIAALPVGGPEQILSTRGTFGYTSPEKGPYNVQLVIENNADPGEVDEWEDMTWQEQLDSRLGYPNRLAMRRLRGRFRATRIDAPDCCVGYAQTLIGTFDAGNGPYHCEGGLEAMESATEKMIEMFNSTPERNADPSKLDGLLD